jgi:hydrogenase nickel incorporation protein HypA/HybF
MHELSIAQSLITEVQDALPVDCPPEQVRIIHLQVGALSGVVPEALTFAFECLAPDTPLADATLQIHTKPAFWVCQSCNAQWNSTQILDACPTCSGIEIRLSGSRDLSVRQVEIE